MLALCQACQIPIFPTANPVTFLFSVNVWSSGTMAVFSSYTLLIINL